MQIFELPRMTKNQSSNNETTFITTPLFIEFINKKSMKWKDNWTGKKPV